MATFGLGRNSNAINLEELEGSSYSGKCITCDDENAGRYTHYSATVPNFGTTDILGFSCEACGYSYNKVNSVQTDVNDVKEKGRKLSLHVCSGFDLRRQLILSDFCTISIRHGESAQGGLDLTIPVSEGRFTTVEGILQTFSSQLMNLKLYESTGAEDNEEQGSSNLLQKISNLIGEIEAGCEGASFDLELDDPSSNSYIGRSPEGCELNSELLTTATADEFDKSIIVEEYERSQDQNAQLGIASKSGEGDEDEERVDADVKTTTHHTKATQEEMLEFLNSMASAYGLGLSDEEEQEEEVNDDDDDDDGDDKNCQEKVEKELPAQ